MDKKQYIEKLYELIEKYDFEELSEDDKSFVMQNSSLEEYNAMRTTIIDTKDLFSEHPRSDKRKSHLGIKKMLAHPVEFYKVAVVVIIISVVGYLITKNLRSDFNQELAAADTVCFCQTDTVYFNQTDTVEVYKEKIIYKDAAVNHNVKKGVYDVLISNSYIRDCSKEICPDDLTILSKIKTKGNLTNDSALTGFFVSVN